MGNKIENRLLGLTTEFILFSLITFFKFKEYGLDIEETESLFASNKFIDICKFIEFKGIVKRILKNQKSKGG